ncbi:hypothetical protein PGTUg99_017102 [Puccinia graminis f. sp. tritici]|uniref:Small ribosomal subunit protein mS33 n=1 Tax=Puccinia graminis f. sp. tritici TaxID=56615 RepID=A0A5B0Q0M0_PUCGR|nr:hypothetical protein PGTUg99_017102 [Puccinia graminis f. sp. tritici]
MASVLKIPTKFRLQALAKAQSTVFQTPYNPRNLRTGDRYLTKKLKGPLLQTYYPPIRPVNFKQLNHIFVQTAKANGVTGRDLEYWKLPDLREEKRHVTTHSCWNELLITVNVERDLRRRVKADEVNSRNDVRQWKSDITIGLHQSLNLSSHTLTLENLY